MGLEQHQHQVCVVLDGKKREVIRERSDGKYFNQRTDRDFIAISVSFDILEAESLFACTTSFSVASNIWRPTTK